MTCRFALFALVLSIVLTAVAYELDRESRLAECIPSEPISIVGTFAAIMIATFTIGGLLRRPR